MESLVSSLNLSSPLFLFCLLPLAADPGPDYSPPVAQGVHLATNNRNRYQPT